jgi:hypothetical protein
VEHLGKEKLGVNKGLLASVCTSLSLFICMFRNKVWFYFISANIFALFRNDLRSHLIVVVHTPSNTVP